ncbi:pectinesterase [Musa troglodytarum]|uniref:Pectinesterase n=1 Tax=Musa troglodytarum TaxID=320322 RepID=A0A9E7HL32_9LILI|nr:pectinesterase [Musa troglodytarum]
MLWPYPAKYPPSSISFKPPASAVVSSKQSPRSRAGTWTVILHGCPTATGGSSRLLPRFNSRPMLRSPRMEMETSPPYQRRSLKYVMYVKEGVYNEYMEVDVHAWNLTMYGDGPDKTIVTGSKNYVDGVRTFKSATFDAVGDGFMAVSMAFENTAGPAKGQAVALRVQAARSIFLHCRMQAYQDTLYAHSHRQFYRNCLISGTIDFIFGDAAAAAAVFQKCFLTMRRPQAHHGTVVFAQSRVRVEESTGFVSQNCSFVAVLAFTGATHPRLPVQRLLHHHHRP